MSRVRGNFKTGRFPTREELEHNVKLGIQKRRTFKDMAEDFEVSPPTISRIVHEQEGTYDQETAESSQFGKAEMERLMQIDKIVREAAKHEVYTNMVHKPFQEFRAALIGLGVQDIQLGMDFGEIDLSEATAILEDAVTQHLSKQFEEVMLRKLAGQYTIQTEEGKDVRKADSDNTKNGLVSGDNGQGFTSLDSLRLHRE